MPRHGTPSAVREALLPSDAFDDLLLAKFEPWKKYYLDRYGLRINLEGTKIPVASDDFDHLVVVAQGLTLNRLVAVGRQSYKMWTYQGDLDKAVIHNDREPTENYGIWVRGRQEADEELVNLSAKDIWSKKLTGETLLERLIHGDEWFTRIDQHLDQYNATLCVGSRCLGCGVPSVYCSRGQRKTYVSFYRPQDPQDLNAYLRCRLAVS